MTPALLPVLPFSKTQTENWALPQRGAGNDLGQCSDGERKAAGRSLLLRHTLPVRTARALPGVMGKHSISGR